ncbi:hypothetical protein DFJ63DRAFT_333855 [Scheffersomyces coipomensis]|uniref:uncharacterized protein n=1 Tax=Scheffersomyces coipomensis TaxID=1788519 RepID=UPI00315CB303
MISTSSLSFERSFVSNILTKQGIKSFTSCKSTVSDITNAPLSTSSTLLACYTGNHDHNQHDINWNKSNSVNIDINEFSRPVILDKSSIPSKTSGRFIRIWIEGKMVKILDTIHSKRVLRKVDGYNLFLRKVQIVVCGYFELKSKKDGIMIKPPFKIPNYVIEEIHGDLDEMFQQAKSADIVDNDEENIILPRKQYYIDARSNQGFDSKENVEAVVNALKKFYKVYTPLDEEARKNLRDWLKSRWLHNDNNLLGFEEFTELQLAITNLSKANPLRVISYNTGEKCFRVSIYFEILKMLECSS